jgi:hypothetical protein
VEFKDPRLILHGNAEPLEKLRKLKTGGFRNSRYLAKTESSQKIQVVVDMIYISCVGLCGEEGFRFR